VKVRKSPAQCWMSEGSAEHTKLSCQRSLSAHCGLQLGISEVTIQNVLHKRPKLHTHTAQILC
jgi:hypothetical protein